jgi:hypothetical protein
MDEARPATVPSAEARRTTAAARTRRDVACQVAGGVGTVASCAGMIASLAAGVLGSVGAAGGSLVTRGGMSGMGSMPGAEQPQTAAYPLLTVLNQNAVPLLLVSIILMLAGVARAGWRAAAWVAAGSVLLLATMLPTPSQIAAWLLGAGFLLVIIGYVAAWHAVRVRRGIPAHT